MDAESPVATRVADALMVFTLCKHSVSHHYGKAAWIPWAGARAPVDGCYFYEGTPTLSGCICQRSPEWARELQDEWEKFQND